MTSPLTPPPRPNQPPRSLALFEWIEDAGLIRSRGWVGGVSAAIGGRTGIDAALIRGIFVVLTLIGFPAILLYGLLWLVLPNEESHISLRQLLRGRFQPEMLGIAATFLLALIPFTSLASRAWQVLSYPGMTNPWSYGEGLSVNIPLLMSLLAVAVALLAAIVVVALANRQRPAAHDVGVTVVAQVGVGPDGSAHGSLSESAHELAEGVDADSAPPLMVAPTDAADLTAWRAQHAHAQAERDAFLTGQQGDVAARAQDRSERDSARGAFLSQMLVKRAERRLVNPRASIGYNLGVAGLAVIVACIVVLVRAHAGVTEAIALGAFTGSVVSAAGMIIAGLLRRRSGFLAFGTVVALVLGAGSAIAAKPSGLVWDGAAIFAGNLAEVNQPFGGLTVYAEPWSINSAVQTPLRITKGDGYTTIYVAAGVDLEFEAAIGDGGNVYVVMVSDEPDYDMQPISGVERNGTTFYSVDIDTELVDGPQVSQKISIDQTSGYVEILVNPEWEQTPSDRIAPTITINN